VASGAVVAVAVVLAIVSALPQITTGSNGTGGLTTTVPFPDDNVEGRKFFLIGYPLVAKDTAQKVSINDYSWLKAIVENGETIVSAKEAEEFGKSFNKNSDFAVLMEDGITTKYLDIDYYSLDLIPNVAYMKAYWTQDFQSAPSKRINIADQAWLSNAVEEKSQWIPLENEADEQALKALLEVSKVKRFEVEDSHGRTSLFEIRYIGPSQETVS
jgi:hypothetical protein